MSFNIDALVLTRFFIAILSLLFLAHFFGYVFDRLKMPRVVGEIFGGLLLGPSCFGHLFPELHQAVFLNQGQLVSVIYWFGLILLMFCSGFEIDGQFDRKDKKAITALTAGTTVIPLIFGWIATSFFDMSKLMGPADNVLALRLVITVSLAVTSIPVISKIFMDLGIIQTPFAKIVLATATIHDIILWVFVSIATGLVSAKAMSLGGISTHVLISVLFFAAALVLVPRLIKFTEKFRPRSVLKGNEAACVVLIILVFIVLASVLDVNLVFGAFLAGIVVNFIKNQKFQETRQHIKEFSMAFFVPIYFAVVGIKLDLLRHFDAMFFIGFVVFAVIVQTIAVLLTARSLKYNWLSSINLAVVLNDRGGPCIVLATLAFDLGIISENFFVTLILLAIVTSLSAGSWLRYVLKNGWPLLDK